MLKYKWIVGPRKGMGIKIWHITQERSDLKRTSQVALEASHPDYTTLLFNFDNNVMYSSGIFRFGTKNQFTRFDGRNNRKFETRREVIRKARRTNSLREARKVAKTNIRNLLITYRHAIKRLRNTAC